MSLFQAIYLMVSRWCFWAMHALVLHVGTFTPSKIPCFRIDVGYNEGMDVMSCAALLCCVQFIPPTQSWLPLLSPQTVVSVLSKKPCAVKRCNPSAGELWGDLSNYCCWGRWESLPVLSPTWEDTEGRYSSKSLFLLLFGKLSAMSSLLWRWFMCSILSPVVSSHSLSTTPAQKCCWWRASSLQPSSEDLRMRSCLDSPVWKGLALRVWSHYGRTVFPVFWGWT